MGPLVTVAGFYVVHRLTQWRDKDKAVFDLHKAVAEHASDLKPVIMAGWEGKKKEERLAAITETKWRLQQLGGMVERLRRVSTKRGRFWFWPPLRKIQISITSDMSALRDTITDDTFDDETRGVVSGKGGSVEHALGAFLLALDEALLTWMD